jgi:hypothetical protein
MFAWTPIREAERWSPTPARTRPEALRRMQERKKSQKDAVNAAVPTASAPNCGVPRWPINAVSTSEYSGSAASAPRAGTASARIVRSSGRRPGRLMRALQADTPALYGSAGNGSPHLGVLCSARAVTDCLGTRKNHPTISPPAWARPTLMAWTSVARPVRATILIRLSARKVIPVDGWRRGRA